MLSDRDRRERRKGGESTPPVDPDEALRDLVGVELPFWPVSRQQALVDAAKLANSGNPEQVITTLASCTVCTPSWLLSDEALYNTTTKTTLATAGATVGSVWNANANTSFFTQATSGNAGVQTTSDGLDLAAGKTMTTTVFQSFTAGSRMVVMKAAADPAPNSGIFESNGTITSPVPNATGSIADWFGAGASTANRVVYNPSALISSYGILASRSTSTTDRGSRWNTETENTSVANATTSFPAAATLTLGNATASNTQQFNVKGYIARNSVFSTQEFTDLHRLLSFYHGLGLY